MLLSVKVRGSFVMRMALGTMVGGGGGLGEGGGGDGSVIER
jgi:hypothetical protein